MLDWQRRGFILVWFYNKLTMTNKYRRLCTENRNVIANMRQATSQESLK